MTPHDHVDDCVFCGSLCSVDDGAATVTAEDVARIKDIGLLMAADAEVWRLEQERRIREEYGTDDPMKACQIIIQKISQKLGIGSGPES